MIKSEISMEKNNEWESGPDELMPANSFYSTQLDMPVKLRSDGTDLKKYPSMSIYSLFKQTVKQRPNHPALASKGKSSSYVFLNYNEYWGKCTMAAKSFIKLGLQPSQVVSIIGFNSPEWFIADLGCIFASGVTCGIYTTNSVEACEYVFKDCKSEIVVVEDKNQLDKVLKCKENNIPIKKIIQYHGPVDDSNNGLIISWNEFMELGKDVSDDELNQRVKLIVPNKCASLIYTSGTTGNPKAAMLSHDNIVYNSRYVAEIANTIPFQERLVSYLPLSHIAAQAVDIYASLYLGATVYFAQPDALKGSLAVTIKEAKPTLFWGVPRVWEKLQEAVAKKIKNLNGIKLSLFTWAQNTAYAEMTSNFNGKKNSGCSFSIAKALVLNKVHTEMGLNECRTFISGAAPITKETLDFFIKLGIPLTETFGMSESCGPHTVGTFFSNRVTSVGKIDQKFNRCKISNKDHEGSGELCLYGRNVFMGYLNNEEKTAETFDSNDWLRTGDIGKIDSEEFLFITGRIKELIITAGGENIAPVPVEDRVKLELSQLVSNCILVGDKRKYLVILICLKSKIDLNTLEPLDELTSETIDWLKTVGSESTKVSDIIGQKDSIVYKEIENGIKRANEYSTSRASKVQKFEILPRDFSLANGELGPTLKLRRPIVHKMYSTYIDKLYADNSSAD